MSIHGAGDKSASVVSIKDCKVFCYFDTSHMSTPLPGHISFRYGDGFSRVSLDDGCSGRVP